MASTKDTILKRGIAQAIDEVGFSNVADDIRKSKNRHEVSRNVEFVIRSQKRGACSPKLTDPLTRKKSVNPSLSNCKKFHRKLREATASLD